MVAKYNFILTTGAALITVSYKMQRMLAWTEYLTALAFDMIGKLTQ